jgi:UDP-glucuronate 4-epimerase
MAMWIFTDAMLRGKPIKVFNHGQMSRDFTSVDDIVQGLCGALFAPGLDNYEIFNLGNHRSENLLDMIGLLARTLGVEPKMEFLPMQDGDVPATYADVAKAQAKLGFSPTTPISAGIPAFVEWYREYHGI